ncbi:tetratricopeptide repeat protein [Hymenobacter sp. ASUV-10]|uniref:Tetratricopeptide repeat protein n=1 Tax=Hymenobacter aranciens TaxID=3063996 RepID=A0ABT9BB23_9BACT|nr:tetratricopeptide repeat protein [Hymenobacter sp. ASUV-10]MDO7875433.1 tetratricopeptide repeat protein [Hymenobacter sp. ASUV-10]
MKSTATHGAALALLLALPVAAQQNSPVWPRQGQLIKEGIALHDKEDYVGAIAKYRAVTPGDSSYAWAQSELAMSLSAAGKHEEAIAAAKEAIARQPFEPQTYNTLADSQEELKQVEAALATYQQALKLFPYSPQLYFNQGLTLMRQNRVAEAMTNTGHAVELRPLHAPSQRIMGVLAAQQGQTAHALLSFLTYLCLNENEKAGNEVLVYAERLSQGASIIDDKDRVKPSAPNTAFAELDQLLESKVALQKGYTSKVNFPAAVVKQTQLLVEKFPLDAPADDFWMRTYGPMVRVLKQDDNLTTFTYFILRHAESPSAAKWVKSNEGKVKKMLLAVMSALIEPRREQQVAGGAAGQRQPAWFTTQGVLDGLGPGHMEGDNLVLTGDWISVETTGAVEALGRYNAAGKRVGEWKSLRPDGTAKKTFTYDDKGELEGRAQEFHPNGQSSFDATYHQGKLEGTLTLYNECGIRTEARTFKAGDLEGPYTTYYTNGQVRYRATTHADKVEGQEERFYPDGTLQYTQAYVAGNQQGPLVVYYSNKTISKKANYDQDKLHGAYVRYHPNGQPSESGSFAHGLRTGTWREFYDNGKPENEATYDEKGEQHGLYHQYNETGRLYCDTEYAHGRITRLQYYDAAGKLLLEQPVKKGRTTVKAMAAGGWVNSSGTFTDGQLTGDWEWYFRDGTVRERMHFDDKGTKVGTGETFHQGGQVHRRVHYGANGQEDGYYEEFNIAGLPTQTGYYRDGEQQGQWRNYYVNGKVSEEYEYHRGEKNGVHRSYAPSGKLSQEQLYVFGKLHQITAYDSTGKVTNIVKVQPDSKLLATKYPSGKPRYESSLLCYEGYGPTTWLRPDGQTESTVSMLDGQRQGASKSLHPNGKVRSTGNYDAGQATGEWTFYFPNGQIESKGQYYQGQSEGEWTFYHPNGQIEQVQTYRAGDYHGSGRCYNPAGELLIERQYQGDDLLRYRGPGAPTAPYQEFTGLSGNIKTSFANGKPAVDETLSHGLHVGALTRYYASGEVFERINYDKGMRKGLMEAFYPGGKPMSRENYLYGALHGRCRYYRPDGTLEREESYLCGELNGPTTYFDAVGKPLRTEHYWNAMLYDTK